MAYPPRCEHCGRELRPLSGAGRWTWFCPADCDRIPPEERDLRPRCPKCRSLDVEPFVYMFSSPGLLRCKPCGAVWTK